MSVPAVEKERMSSVHPRAIVLHGEISPEAPPDEQDTLLQAEAIADSLGRLGFAVDRLTATLDLDRLRRELLARSPGLVFNLVESLGGSGRLIPFVPALLDELDIPYTGVPTPGLFLTSHKILAKRMLARHGIATPDWIEARDAACALAAGHSRRWILKSVWEHASLGMDDAAVVRLSDGDVPMSERLAAKMRRHGGEWFAELYIEGREFNISLVEEPGGPGVLPLAEIAFESFPEDKPRIVSYRAKWEPDSFEYRHTVRRFPDFTGNAEAERLGARLRSLALDCWGVFALRGYARVDVRLDEGGTPWVLEVNANPCLAPDAGLTAAAAEAGMDFDRLIATVVAAARAAHPEIPGHRR